MAIQDLLSHYALANMITTLFQALFAFNEPHVTHIPDPSPFQTATVKIHDGPGDKPKVNSICNRVRHIIATHTYTQYT